MSAAPSTTRRSRAASTRQWTARSVAGIRPHELRGILSQAAYGNVQDLADLFSAMLADHQVRAAVETRLAGVTSAKLKVLPATGGDVELNREVAAFASEVFAASHDFARTTTHGLSNIFYGWSVLEHEWRNVGGVFLSTQQHPVYHRDTRFVNAWELEVRGQGSAGSSTATGASTGSSSWVSISKEPARWIAMHPTTMGLLPPLSGALHAAVWPWLFRKWATIYQQVGLERFANPLLLGRLKQQATDETRAAMSEALAELRGDQVGVVEGEDEIQILEPTRSPADSWKDAIASFDAAIVKAVLGSTLNVEVGAGGGNRATAQSQNTVTIHPRLLADADQWVQRGLVDQWLRPALRFNARLFGGRSVAPPLVILQLTAEAGPQADDLMLRAGALTVDELRESRGWPRWGDERGAAIARDKVVEKQADAWVRSAGQGDDAADEEGRAA
jgi:phage gp29-like protein